MFIFNKIKQKKTAAILFIFGLLLFVSFFSWYLKTPEKLIYTTIAPSKFVTIDNIKIHYVEEDDDGTQPPLLLVHGFASSTQSWYKMWPLLQADYHLIAIDLPGFGLSDKSTEPIYNLDFHTRILKTFIEKQIQKKTYAMTWSMGSLITLWLAKNNPELFYKIASVTPALDPNIVFGPFQILPYLAPYLAKWFITPQFIELTFFRVFEKQPQGEDRKLFIDRAYYPFWQNSATFYSLINHIPLIKDSRNPTGLADLKVPFMVLAARHDKVVRMHHYDNLKSVFPNLNMVVHEESGHCLHIEQPEWVTKHVQDFFKQN